MEKSNVERVKDAFLYAPVGAFGFIKDNVPTFFSVFVSRGKRDVAKTTMTAEEKLSSTKEHGQFVAMGTPIVKSRAERVVSEAKNKGEDLAHVSIDIALGALGIFENTVKSIASTVLGDEDTTTKDTPDEEASNKVAPETSKPVKSQTEKVQEAKAASKPKTPKETNFVNKQFEERKSQDRLGQIKPAVPISQNLDSDIDDEASNNFHSSTEITIEIGEDYDAYRPSQTQSHTETPSFIPSSFETGEGDFIAEPVDPTLPLKIEGIYETLSAPEIIDLLDDFGYEELANIRNYEADFRNRQTIIHAINYRLDQKI